MQRLGTSVSVVQQFSPKGASWTDKGHGTSLDKRRVMPHNSAASSSTPISPRSSPKLPFSTDACTLRPGSEGAAAADELTYIYANGNNYHLIALANESDYMARWVMSPSSRSGTRERSRDLLLPAQGGLRPRAASGRA